METPGDTSRLGQRGLEVGGPWHLLPAPSHVPSAATSRSDDGYSLGRRCPCLRPCCRSREMLTST